MLEKEEGVPVKRTKRTLGVGSLLALFMVASASAAERSYLRSHQVVRFGGHAVAEFTRIMTADKGLPFIARTLYQDDTGARLVVREVTENVEGVGSISVELIETGEKLTVTMQKPATITVGLGSEKLEFSDAEVLPPHVKKSGASLLENASPSFQGALRRLAQAGCSFIAELEPIGFLLRELFFSDLPKPSGPAPDFSETMAVTKNFDPAVHPATEFESAFGAAFGK